MNGIIPITRATRITTIALAAAIALSAPGHATKLDLSSSVDIKTANYTKLITGSQRTGQSIYSENAALGFIIKGIKLEKTTNNAYMDVGIVLNSVGTAASTTTLSAPQFTQGLDRLPHTDGTPYVREAYIKIYKFMRNNITATLGRQAFTLGQGITLADDGIGLPGMRFEAEKLYKNIKGEIFYFRPNTSTGFTTLYGGSLYYPSNEGLWHIYHLTEKSEQASSEPGLNTASRNKTYTGLRYFLNYSQLNFDGEFIIQKGKAKNAGGDSIKYNAHAFLLKGSWTQDIGFVGTSRMRAVYGKASGNPGVVTNESKAFFPAFGHRFKGFERDGFGEIAGATLYDMIQTSNTVTGFPAQASGVNVMGIGADMPYKKFLITLDYYKFRASQNILGQSKQLGNEMDLKITYPMGENLRLKAVYATFKPMTMVFPGVTPIKLLSLSLTAKF